MSRWLPDLSASRRRMGAAGSLAVAIGVAAVFALVLHALGRSMAPPPEPRTSVAALQPGRRPEALPCSRATECVDGRCTLWFEDADADGFGNPDTSRGFCGERAPASKVPLVRNGRDCCDLNERVRPTQTEAFSVPIEASCPLARGYDYDCDGVVRYGDDMGASVWAGACDDGDNASNEPNMPCAERGGIFLGPGNALGLTLEDLVTPDGEAALCGNASVEWKRCSLVGAACEGRRASAPPCN